MIGLRIEVIFHWGFWTRTPNTSRYQPSLSIPPPTTLLGALVNPIISLNLSKINGEVILNDRKPSSPVIEFIDMIAASSFYYYNSQYAFIYDDINKYITLHFQTKTKDKPEEKDAGGRRYLLKYRSGALKVGKVVAPSSKGVVCYLIDEDKAEKLLGNDWKKSIQIAAYNINRIGSKESIVSVESVKMIEDIKSISTPSKVRTKCYIPLKYVDVTQLKDQYYVERFWSGGWSRGADASREHEDYIIPGTRMPISSKPIEVSLTDCRAYKIEQDEVLVVA